MTSELTLMILRWIHFIAGVTWIGHLYFFNFVNVPFAKTMDGDTKKKVVPQLMPRALWWFRWGAMFTFLSGWTYLFYKLVHVDGMPLSALHQTPWGKWITLGGLMGSIMWFNVWFIIWPIQKKVIAGVKGAGPAVDATVIRKAFLASRTNTYLSMPMLFCMGAASHFSQFTPTAVAAVLAAGAGVAYVLIEMVSAKAGAEA